MDKKITNLFSSLKDWKIGSQKLKNELREEENKFEKIKNVEFVK